MNEVEVVVRAKDDTDIVFSNVVRKSKKAGEDAGDNLHKGFSGKLLNVFDRLGGLGGKITDKLTEGLGKFGTMLPGFLGDAVGKLPPQGQAIAGVLVAGLSASLVPVLGAAISSAVLLAVGGGVLFAGIKAAADNPNVVKAFDSLKKRASTVFENFGKPFEAPLIRAAKTFERVLTSLQKPIEHLGKIIAPVIDQLAPALGEFFKSMMPGITKAAEASVPLFKTLAAVLPVLGKSIGDFFEKISKNSDDTTQFFQDLLTVIVGLIDVTGTLIAKAASLYIRWRRAMSNMVDAVNDVAGAVSSFARRAVSFFNRVASAGRSAWNWVTGVGGRLAGALRSVQNFVSRVIAAIRNIPRQIYVDVVPRVIRQGFGGILSGLGSIFAHGGVVGAAATGGPRGGLTLVGEHGPELANLPAGTQVHSNPDTMRMLSGSGGSYVVHNHIHIDGREVAVQILEPLRELTRTRARGSAQRLLGQAGVS